MIRFYADNINDRRVWSWVDGFKDTADEKEIETFRALGCRFEYLDEKAKDEDIEKFVEQAEKKVVRRKRTVKKKVS